MNNSTQFTDNSLQKSKSSILNLLSTVNCQLSTSPGMTLIETLVAISILSVAIIAPMTLTVQSLAAAYYARDQIVAANLAQEAIESVRSIRDGNILRIALNQPDATCTPTNLLCGIPIDADFTVDTRDNTVATCSGTCSALQTDGDLYGYSSGWTTTPFTRTVHAVYVDGGQNEIRVTVTVSWRTKANQVLQYTISENLYRWVDDGSGA